MLVPALITALVVIWGLLDEMTLQLQTTRAIIIGPLVGLLLGDPAKGLAIGASVELMFIAGVIVGAAQIPDVTMAAAVATALAILGNVPTEVAITLAVPVAIFGQMLHTARLSILGVPLVHLADPFAAKGNIRGLVRTPFIGLLVFAVMFGLPTFLAVYFGPELVSGFAKAMPPDLIKGFGVASGFLPAIGFGMILAMIRARHLLPYLFLGFVMAAYLKLNILGIVITAVALAFLHIARNNSQAKEA